VFAPLKEKGVPQKPLKIQGKPSLKRANEKVARSLQSCFFVTDPPNPRRISNNRYHFHEARKAPDWA
jgi:hypothetical protein